MKPDETSPSPEDMELTEEDQQTDSKTEQEKSDSPEKNLEKLRTEVRDLLDSIELKPEYTQTVELYHYPPDDEEVQDLEESYGRDSPEETIILPPVTIPQIKRLVEKSNDIMDVIQRSVYKKHGYDYDKVNKYEDEDSYEISDEEMVLIYDDMDGAFVESEELKVILDEIVSYYSKINEIKQPKIIMQDQNDYWHDEGEWWPSGHYSAEDKTMFINEFMIESGGDLVETTLHEWLHHWFEVKIDEEDLIDFSGDADEHHKEQFIQLGEAAGLDILYLRKKIGRGDTN